MAYLFDAFRQLIETQPGQKDLEQSVKGETHVIISTIDQELFETQSLEQAQFYIQKVEIAIARYEARVNEFIQCNDSISRARHLNLCLACLDKIRHHIETTYYPYRDPASPISRRTISEMAKPIAVQKDRLAALLDQCDISCKLKNIILHPANEIIASQCPEIPRQKVEYVTSFINELVEFIESLGQVDEQHLLQHLYVLNFNTTPLLSYICDRYKSIRADIVYEVLCLDQPKAFRMGHASWYYQEDHFSLLSPHVCYTTAFFRY